MGYDTDNFQEDVLDRSHDVPVLVDFWAEWCGPCRVLGPTLERLAAAAGDRWELVKLNTEHHPDVAGRYGIRSIPNVKLFVDGEVVDEFVGALPAVRVRDWLAKALPSRYAEPIAKARKLLADGHPDKAGALLEPIVACEPEDDAAIMLLSEAYMARDADLAASTAARVQPGSKFYAQARGMQTLAELLKLLTNPETLPAAPVKARFLEAVAAIRQRHYGDALSAFLDVLHQDRRYADEGARRACIAIFQLLGDDHELTQKFRPLFASAVLV